jgi:hypothetical protein
MRVKLLRTAIHAGRLRPVGAVLDVDEVDARGMVKRGAAQYLPQRPTPWYTSPKHGGCRTCGDD